VASQERERPRRSLARITASPLLRLRGSDHISSDDEWLNFRCALQFAARGIGRNIFAGIFFSCSLDHHRAFGEYLCSVVCQRRLTQLQFGYWLAELLSIDW